MNLNYAAIARDLDSLNQQIEQLTTRRTELYSLLLASIPEGDTVEAGDHTLTIQPGSRRINAAALQNAYPPAEHPHLYKLVPNTDTVRKHLSPAQLETEKLTTPSKPTVKLK